MENQKPHKEKRIREITLMYYLMPEIRKAIFQFSQNRECIPQYYEGFGKRPDNFQYESDILEQVKKGATSFHCSEELWQDPLEISNEFSEQEFNELRIGWDLLLDVDSPYLEYSKIYTQLLIDILKFHGIENVNVKFSGSKGFHIIIPWKAFPKEIYNQKTKDMFPEWPRAICEYLSEIIKPKLIEKIYEGNLKEIAEKSGRKEEDLLIMECNQCHRTAEKKELVTWVCENCKKLGEITRIEKNKRILKCPECGIDLSEKSREEIWVCEFCNLNSYKSPLNFGTIRKGFIPGEDKSTQKERIKSEQDIEADLILVSPRHLFRMPYSVDYDEPICIKKDNKIEITEIGKFVDNFFQNKEDLQIADISGLNYEAISLNIKDNKTRFNKIKRAIRHKINEDLYSIKLESGRKVKVTSGHSLFILRKGKIEIIKGNKLKKGDHIVSLRKLNLLNKNLINLNISKELIRMLDDKKKRNIFLYNFDDSIFSYIYKMLSIDEKRNRSAYNWKICNILPLDIYELLVQENDFLKEKFKDSKIKFCKHGGGAIGLSNNIKIDKSFMRLLGYYISEGHCDSRGRVTLSFGAHEKELIEDSKNIVRGLGLNPRIEKPHKTATQVVVQSTILKLIFASLFKCGKNAKEKRVPSIIWGVNNELKTEFLNSYIKGDGHLEKRWSKILISTVSKKLKEDLCFLLTSLGLGYSLSERKITRYPKGKNLSYIIIIQGKEDVARAGFKSFSTRKKNSLINRFPIKELKLEQFILKSRWKNQYALDKIIRRGCDFIKNLNPNKNVLKLISGDCTFLRVVEIKKTKPKYKYVYDLSVKNDENFVGGNCILLHNSLHEKTALASVVIDKDKIKDFQIKDAKPFKFKAKDFYPNAKPQEARELLLQALDYREQKESKEQYSKFSASSDLQSSIDKKGYRDIKITNPTKDIFPPCVNLILKGIKQDGRKRALFILINFFKSLGLDNQELENKINEWNEKNYKPLKQGYIRSQLQWHNRQEARLPPNCDKPHYKDLAICKPDELCRQIKNPVNYSVKKYFREGK